MKSDRRRDRFCHAAGTVRRAVSCREGRKPISAPSGPTDVAALDAATNFDSSEFANPVAGTFGWKLDPVGQSLSLTYTTSAVPEPGTLFLVGLAAAGFACWRRRNQPTSCPHAGLA